MPKTPETQKNSHAEAIVAELLNLGRERFGSDRQFALATGIDRSTMKYMRAHPARCDLGKLQAISNALEYRDLFDLFAQVRKQVVV